MLGADNYPEARMPQKDASFASLTGLAAHRTFVGSSTPVDYRAFWPGR